MMNIKIESSSLALPFSVQFQFSVSFDQVIAGVRDVENAIEIIFKCILQLFPEKSR